MAQIEWKRVAIFIAVAFGISWVVGFGIMAAGGPEALPVPLPDLSLYLILIAVLYMPAPAVANVVTRLVTGEGFDDLRLGFDFKAHWYHLLFSWLGTVILLAVGAAVYFALFPQYFDASMSSYMAQIEELTGQAVPLPPAALLITSIVSALSFGLLLNIPFMFGEEFGWRAYLQQKLMPLGPRPAMLLMGLIWGLWHAPIIAMGHNYAVYTPDYPGAPWSGIAMMCWFTFTVGTFLGWMSHRTDSVWPAVIGHGVLNGLAGAVAFFIQGEPNLLIGPLAPGVIGGLGFAVVTLLIFTIPGSFEASSTEQPPVESVPA